MLDNIGRAAAVLQAIAVGQEPPEAAVECIAPMIKADIRVFLTSSAPRDGARPFAGYNFPDEALTNYIENFADKDVQLQAIATMYTKSPPVIIGDEILSRRELVRSVLFNDYFRPLGAYASIRLESAEIPRYDIQTLRLAFWRGKIGADFGADERRFLEALSPHFDAATLGIAERRAGSHATLAAAFEHAADAVAILDRNAHLRYANATFQRLCQRIAHARNLAMSRTPLECGICSPATRFRRNTRKPA